MVAEMVELGEVVAERNANGEMRIVVHKLRKAAQTDEVAEYAKETAGKWRVNRRKSRPEADGVLYRQCQLAWTVGSARRQQVGEKADPWTESEPWNGLVQRLVTSHPACTSPHVAKSNRTIGRVDANDDSLSFPPVRENN
jgi:hypothetical protein